MENGSETIPTPDSVPWNTMLAVSDDKRLTQATTIVFRYCSGHRASTPENGHWSEVSFTSLQLWWHTELLSIRIPVWEIYLIDSELLISLGCPPGIRTPIERVRVASPTIEREGNTGFIGSCRLGGSHNQPPL